MNGNPDYDGDGWDYPDDEDPDDFAQSMTACCPRETIPDSCSCPDGCECTCLDCQCGWGEDDVFVDSAGVIR